MGEANRFNILQSEATSEDTHAPQQALLQRRQQVVAPVDCQAEGLMTRERCAASSGEQGEAVAQPVEDLLRAESPGPDRSKLDCERQTVEAPANGDDGCPVRGAELEGTGCRRRPLGKQQHGLVLSELAERFFASIYRQLERRDGYHVLTRHLQRLPAGGDPPHPRRRPAELS